MLHIRKDDEVQILAGRDRGKRGKVLRVFPARRKAIVEKINMIKKHTRPNPQANIQGGVIEREAPIDLSNLMVVCRECGQAARVGYSQIEDGDKVRVCKNCGGTIDR